MSRLIEKLKRAREASGGGIGFAQRAGPATGPALVVLGALEPALAASLGEPLGASVDAVLLRWEGTANWATPALAPGPWGVEFASGGAAPPLDVLGESGCDFLLFAADARVDLFAEESFGRLLSLDPRASDGELRAMGSLDVDAVVVPLADVRALTVGDLAALQRVLLLTGRPLILRCAGLPAEALLAPLRDSGVAGLLVEVPTAEALEPLAQLRQQAQRLPPPRRRNDRLEASPYLSQPGGGARGLGRVRRRPLIPH